MSRKTLLGAATIVAALISFSASADTMPLADGAYLRNPQWCEKYFINDLDFIDFEVGQEGRSFGFIEQGCIVHSIKQIRDNRYSIDADCTEAGEVFDRKIILDINLDQSIRIDGGELHHFCRQQKQTNSQSISTSKKSETATEKLTRRFKDELAISKWAKADNRCRGGFDTAANTEKACDERNHFYQKIRKQDWCFGKEGQSRSQYQWHDCETDSLQ